MLALKLISEFIASHPRGMAIADAMTSESFDRLAMQFEAAILLAEASLPRAQGAVA